MKFSHCHECGTEYAELNNPRTCGKCGHVKWFNPSPVVIVLQPVKGPEGEEGLLIAKRGIEPKKGEWALVGGFIEVGERIEDAAYREFKEETGLTLAAHPELWFNDVTTAGHLMMVCIVPSHIEYEAFLEAKPCAKETEELGILYRTSDIKMAFPIHQKAVDDWYGVD